MTHRLRLLLPVALSTIIVCAAMRTQGPHLDRGQDLTPPSELALLMREMAAHADSVKAGLSRGDKKLPPYPTGIKTLLTATPTKDMHIDPITYPTFGKDYQSKVDALYKAARKDRAAAYNALVQGCANCHTTHCPGPMMRIKTMYVKVGG